MDQIVKRLAPTWETLRELYLKSGNICAFPGCHNVLINENGDFIGQVCHIEAAEVGGERFNPTMTNEERRNFTNLVLLCYEHHKVTNDVKSYTVDVLKKIKKDHEDKYSGIIGKMHNSVNDYGITKSYKESDTCLYLAYKLNFNLTNDENKENAKILNSLLNKMIDLPIETRYLLKIMVNRSYKDRLDNCIVPLYEIEVAIGKDSTYILNNIDILERRQIISSPDFDDNNIPNCRLFPDFETGWNYWYDIQQFCNGDDGILNEIFINLNFTVFD